VIREVKEDGYKYLSVFETDQIKHDEMDIGENPLVGITSHKHIIIH